MRERESSNTKYVDAAELIIAEQEKWQLIPIHLILWDHLSDLAFSLPNPFAKLKAQYSSIYAIFVHMQLS